MGARLSVRGGKVEPRRGYLALGAILYALALPIVTVAIVAHAPQVCAALVHSLLFGTMARVYGWRSLGGAVTAGEIVIGDDEVSFAGRRLASRAEIVQGSIIPEEGRTLVRLDRRGAFSRPIHLVVGDEREASPLLRELHLDAGSAAAEMRIANGISALSPGRQLSLVFGPFFATGLACALAALLPPTFAFPMIALFALLGFAALIVLTFSAMRVRIGTDGIVTRWLGRERFVPFAEVVSSEVYEERAGKRNNHGVRVTTTAGEDIKLPTGRGELGKPEASRLAKRIDDAQLAGRAGSASAATLVRGTRSVGDWLRALRGLGEGAGDLRSPAVPKEVLLRIVEDASATEDARVGAAIAAMTSASDDARARVRVAAEVSASPKLRIALDRVAGGPTDDELAAILEEVAVEEDARR